MTSIWTEGKVKATLQPYNAPSEDACFINEREDSLKLEKKRINHAVFIALGLKDARFSDVDFSYSTFVRCYFRGAEFRGCNFTGCRFIDCNLRNAMMVNCSLLYTEWQQTHVSPDLILANAPEWPNIRRELMEALRVNSLSQGDGVSARKYLLASMRASIEHQKRIVKRHNHYYANKYGPKDQFLASFRLMALQSERFIWGYGESPYKLILCGAILVGIFAVYFGVKAPEVFGFGESIRTLPGGFYEALQFSALTFAANTPASSTTTTYDVIKTAMVIETLLGLVFTGVLAAVLYRWITIRQG
jgi:hypothetical protein